MRISQTMTLLPLIVGGLVLVQAGRAIHDAYTQKAEKVAVKDALEIVSALGDGIIALSFERSVVQVTSNLPGPVDPSFRQLIDEQRAKSNEGLQKALALVEKYEGEVRQPETFVQPVKEQLAKLEIWRDRADRELAAVERDKEFVAQWPVVVPAIVAELEGQRYWLSAQSNAVPTLIMKLQDVRHHMWRIREFGGLERTLIALAAAQQRPMTAAEMASAERLSQTVARSWVILRKYRSMGILSGSDVEAVNNIEQHYFKEYEAIRQLAFERSRAGEPPMAFAEFFAKSGKALTEVENSFASVGAGSVAYIERRIYEDKLALALAALFCFLSIAITIYLVYLARRRVVSRVTGLTGLMERLAKDDFSVDLTIYKSRDEIGEMADAVEIFKRNGLEMQAMRQEQEAARVRNEAEKRALMEKLAGDFEASVGGIVQNVSAAASELQSSAGSMTQTADQTGQRATAVAAASTQASGNVETVAAATEELAASIREISQQVGLSSKVAERAVTESQRASTNVRELADAAQRIGEVVSLINEIASQTNLLALNATIEAARAGEAGKGFAVVASEVKNLASQTAKATEEISAKIADMQSVTGSAVEAIELIGKTISEISQVANGIAAAVEEQNAATGEISRNVQEASQGTQNVNENIVGVQAAVGETTGAAQEVLSAAAELAQQAELLRGQVDSFLVKVRAA